MNGSLESFEEESLAVSVKVRRDRLTKHAVFVRLQRG